MIIGITGNSSVGKSFLIEKLEMNYFLIDADKIGHTVLKLPKCKDEVLSFFGEEILDNNEINRKRLGEIVFNDKEKLEVLTEITHRYILKQIDNILAENIDLYELIIIDAALLIESGLYKKCDKTILVVATYDEKIRRIVERDNVSRELAIARLEKQTDDDVNKKYVDIVFENSYNLKTIQLFNELVNRVKKV